MEFINFNSKWYIKTYSNHITWLVLLWRGFCDFGRVCFCCFVIACIPLLQNKKKENEKNKKNPSNLDKCGKYFRSSVTRQEWVCTEFLNICFRQIIGDEIRGTILQLKDHFIHINYLSETKMLSITIITYFQTTI